MFLDAVWWFRTLLESSLFLIGIPGNAFIIRVYAAKRVKASAHVLIIGLATSDLGACICQIIHLFLRFPATEHLRETNEFFCRVPPAVDGWVRITSSVLTSVIAVDRYFAVCRPHVHRKKLSPRRMRNTVVVCFLVCSVLPLIYLFMIGVTIEDGRLQCRFAVPSWFVNSILMAILTSYILALVIILVAYTKILFAVRKMAKVRPGDNLGTAGRPQHAVKPQTEYSTARVEHAQRNHDALPSVRLPPAAVIPDARSMEPRTEAAIQEPRPVPQAREAGETPLVDTPPVGPGGASQSSVTSAKTPPAPAGKSPVKNRSDEAPVPNDDQAGSSVVAAAGNSKAKTAGTGGDGEGGQGSGAGRDPPPSFHRKTTLMLFLTTVVFVLTYLPVCTVLMFYPLIIPLLATSQSFRIAVNLASFIPLINNMINPILYSAVNRKFRQELWDVLRRPCGR